MIWQWFKISVICLHLLVKQLFYFQYNIILKHSIIFVLNAIKKANDEMMFVRLSKDNNADD